MTDTIYARRIAIAIESLVGGNIGDVENANMPGYLKRIAEAAESLSGSIAAPGEAFPVSPTLNQRAFRTDLGREYYHDGTRWLSVSPLVAMIGCIDGGGFPLSATGFPTAIPNPGVGAQADLWIEAVGFTYYLAGVGNWTGAVKSVNGATVADVATLAITAPASEWTSARVAVGAVLAQAIDTLLVGGTENSGTVTLQIAATLHYRLIAV